MVLTPNQSFRICQSPKHRRSATRSFRISRTQATAMPRSNTHAHCEKIPSVRMRIEIETREWSWWGGWAGPKDSTWTQTQTQIHTSIFNQDCRKVGQVYLSRLRSWIKMKNKKWGRGTKTNWIKPRKENDKGGLKKEQLKGKFAP